MMMKLKGLFRRLLGQHGPRLSTPAKQVKIAKAGSSGVKTKAPPRVSLECDHGMQMENDKDDEQNRAAQQCDHGMQMDR